MNNHTLSDFMCYNAFVLIKTSSISYLDNYWNIYWIVLFALVASVTLFYFQVHLSQVGRQLGESGLKSLPILPFVGSGHISFRNRRDLPGFWRNCFGEYGKTFIFWKGWMPVIVTSDVDIVKRVLSDPAHVGKAKSYENGVFLMGSGLLTSNARKWARDRKILIPGVHNRILYGSEFIPSFNKNSRTLVEIFKAKFPINGETEQDIHAEIGRCTLQIVFETLMDLDVDLQRNPDFKLFEATILCSELANMKTFEPWVKLVYWILGYSKLQKENIAIIQRFFKLVHNNQTEKLNLKSTIANGKDDVHKTGKIIHLMMQNFGDDEYEMISHFNSMIGAGFETTSSTLNQTLFLLANNENVQQKLYEEVLEVFGGNFDRDLTLDDISNLQYTEMVLKECMRFMAPAPLLGRTLGADLSIGDAKIIPKGCEMLMVIYEMHRDPKLFPNPQKFIPERWTDENSNDRNPYSFIPFSSGPRGCFGQKYAMTEMKIILARVVGNFKVISARKPKHHRFKFGINLHPIGGLPVTLIQRHK